MKIDEVTWEFEQDPDAEELLLRALEMLLPLPGKHDPTDGLDSEESSE
jgi:hypothetical protein